MTRLHVFIKVSSEDAFELKAQALNADPRLKAAGIAALKFATDKLFVAGGEFLSELPPPEITTESPSDETTSNSMPEIPVHGPRLRVFLRIINKEDAYDLKAKYLNGDPLLQEAGISDVKLVKKQIFVPVPVQHVEQTPAKEKPKRRGLKWGVIVGVIAAIMVGGFFVIPPLLPSPAKPAPIVQKPTQKKVAATPTHTATPHKPPTPTHTDVPVVVQDPPTPTDTPIPVVAQADCSNDFSSDISDWSNFFVDGLTYYYTDSHHDNDFYGIDKEGWYLFDIHRGNYWVYSICNTVDYSDVQIDVDAQNLGQNDSTATIICRYTPGVGLYEFNIFNDGQYQILFSDFNGTTLTIADGGSNFIKTSNDVNHYTAVCQGSVLTLYVNGNLVKQAKDDSSILFSGKIGLGEAYSDYPATERFDYIVVSQPK